MKNRIILFATIIILFTNCESAAEKEARMAAERQEQIRLEQETERKEAEEEARLERERIEREKRLEQERIEREKQLAEERRQSEIYSRYIDNQLWTGATPYSNCFGRNADCGSYGCSQITVKAPSNADVIVTIKKFGEVYRHAYIRSYGTYTFEMPNGTYQPFFYYGNGWNPEKEMNASCTGLKGGFIEGEVFGKDEPQYLNNNILSYELILQVNGNFSTRPSNAQEAL